MPRKFIKSFKFAGQGAQHALTTQRNLWVHFGLALLILVVACLLKVNLLELSILVIAAFTVIVAEMFNTAIEEVVNILSPEHRQEAALAKNVAAASVLLAALGAVIIGCLILLPKIFLWNL